MSVHLKKKKSHEWAIKQIGKRPDAVPPPPQLQLSSFCEPVSKLASDSYFWLTWVESGEAFSCRSSCISEYDIWCFLRCFFFFLLTVVVNSGLLLAQTSWKQNASVQRKGSFWSSAPFRVNSRGWWAEILKPAHLLANDYAAVKVPEITLCPQCSSLRWSSSICIVSAWFHALDMHITCMNKPVYR